MEANGFGQNSADYCSNDLQSRQSSSLRRSSSTSSAIGRPSFGFSSGFRTNVNEGIVRGNVIHAEHIGDPLPQDSTHDASISIPSTLENPTENGVLSSWLSVWNGSVGRASNSGISLRRLISLPGAHHSQLDADVLDEVVSEAGDSGDRAHSSRGSLREFPHFFLDEGDVFPIPDFLLKSCGFSSDPLAKSTVLPPVSELTSVTVPSEPTDAVMPDKREQKKKLPPSVEYVACLVHIALFGILGVLTRSALQELFGPGVANVTSYQSILYLDLPSNMINSLLDLLLVIWGA